MSRNHQPHTPIEVDSLLCVGELKSAYGIKGWLWVYSHTDPIEQIFDYVPWFISKHGSKSNHTLSITDWRKQGKGLIVKLADVPDRTAAERYCNTKLYIDPADLPEPADDEYYWSELEGMIVVSDTGDVLGRVKQLSETPAHHMLEVEPTTDSADDESRLIPWHDSVIVDVDKDTQTITVAWQLDY